MTVLLVKFYYSPIAFKIFLVKSSDEEKFCVLKSIKKVLNKENDDEPEDYAKAIKTERDIGLLANKCKFLVSLVAAFQSYVRLELVFFLFWILILKKIK